ncbi:MAG: hypothetical protein M3Z17_05685 [Gemmatimonadota bacterium]|nr:hypothetical protein [Gemmatimonadota bacterium]
MLQPLRRARLFCDPLANEIPGDDPKIETLSSLSSPIAAEFEHTLTDRETAGTQHHSVDSPGTDSPLVNRFDANHNGAKRNSAQDVIRLIDQIALTQLATNQRRPLPSLPRPINRRCNSGVIDRTHLPSPDRTPYAKPQRSQQLSGNDEQWVHSAI